MTRLDKTAITKSSQNLSKKTEIKVSILGPYQVIGLEDMIKDKQTFRNHKVECVSDKAFVYYLTKEVTCSSLKAVGLLH